MPLETATDISGLVAANPAASDPLTNAADHMRLIKSVLKNVFQGLVGPLLNASGGIALPYDGTSTAPAIGFASDATAGLYRVGTGELGIVGRMVGQGAIPIGGRMDWFGPDSTIPAGYLPCDGQAVSRTTYAELFTAIGTTWGPGDGSTTFNLPPLQDRFTRHRDNTSGSAAGPVGTLQASQNLAHNHAVSGTTSAENAAHNHNFSGTTDSMNQNQSHTHQLANQGSAGGSSSPGTWLMGSNTTGVAYYGGITSTNTDHEHAFSGTTDTENQNHAHSFSVTSATGSADGAEARPLSATVITCIRAL